MSAEDVWGTVAARERGLLPEQSEIAKLREENKRLRDALTASRSFVELTYDDEGGEEAADAKHVLDQIDLALTQ